jgi:hypothetical protein
VFPLTQSELLESGTDPERGKFIGDKWGGKYLRAPDVLWQLLEEHSHNLVSLGEISEVKFGIKTGANTFFFLDAEQAAEWGIEPEYLVPVLKSPREANAIYVDTSQLPLYLFLCNSSKKQLKGTNALRYIQWGEAQGVHQGRSVAARNQWWSIGDRTAAHVNCNYLIHHLMNFYISSSSFSVCASANSSISQLWINTTGRSNFGGGLLKVQSYEARQIPIVRPTLLDEGECSLILGQYDDFEVGGAGRTALDQYVLSCIGIDETLTSDLQEALHKQIQYRIERASSV